MQGYWTNKINGVWTPYKKNMMVASASKVLAAAMKGELNNMYMALGSGSLEWDSVLPNPSKSDTKLFNEYYRRPINSVTHINEYTGFNEFNGPANEIESAIFGTIDSSLLIDRLIEIIDGSPTPIGETRTITSVTSTAPFIVTVDQPFSIAPTTATKFRVGVVSNEPTGIIDIETIFPASDGNAAGTIREKAIFGGDATDLLESGIMLNVIRHAVLSKDNGTDLICAIRIRLDEN